MKLKKWLVKSICIGLGGFLLMGCSKSEHSLSIGITQIVEHRALDDTREGFKSALKEEGLGDTIRFIERNAQGDMATAQMIAEGFKKDNVDMVFAISTPTAQAAFNVIDDIPIMISAVTDPVSAGLANTLERPGSNVSGTSDEAPIAKQLQLLLDLNIEPKTIGFLYSLSEQNAEVQLDMLKKEAAVHGISVEALGVTSVTEVEQGLDVLLSKVDVLYTPTDNLVASSIHLIVHKSLEKNIPILGAEVAHVEAGALLTCGVDYFELGRQTGRMAAKVLKGESIENMAIQKSSSSRISINLQTAKALGIELSEELIGRSEVIGVE